MKRLDIALVALLLGLTFAAGTACAQKAAPTAPTKAAALAPAGSPSLGPANAAVTIVEFFDPACESCRAMYPHVKHLLTTNPKDVRLVIRYVPFHGQVSTEAIQVLEAARQQKLFEPVLETLMRNQPEWASHRTSDPKKVWEFATAAGLDRARAQTYLATGAVDALIKREVAAVEAADIRGTPTFFVNGKLLPELGPQQLDALVAE